MEMNATTSVDAVLGEVDVSLGSNRRCHAAVSYACSAFVAGLYGEAMDVRPPDRPLSDGVVALRPWTLADVPAVAEACDEEEIARWMHQIPTPYGEADAREYVRSTQAAWLAGTGAFFAVVDSASGELAGSIAIHVTDPALEHVEVGYWAAARARGRGLTTRALRLISAWAVREGAKRVQLRADVRNVASLRVAEKAGFRREGTLRAAGLNERENCRIDYAVYSILPHEVE
jgi:RimJ/RimL family protein N-acetyltransferase